METTFCVCCGRFSKSAEWCREETPPVIHEVPMKTSIARTLVCMACAETTSHLNSVTILAEFLASDGWCGREEASVRMAKAHDQKLRGHGRHHLPTTLATTMPTSNDPELGQCQPELIRTRTSSVRVRTTLPFRGVALRACMTEVSHRVSHNVMNLWYHGYRKQTRCDLISWRAGKMIGQEEVCAGMPKATRTSQLSSSNDTCNVNAE